ncbi:MAG: RND family transporter, partial [Pseudomonadota bacterium]
MNTFKETLFDLAIRRPFLVMLLVLAAVFGAAYGMSKLTFKSDYRIFFGAENPQLTAYEKMQATFTKNDSVSFIVVPKDGVVFKEETLTAIHFLTNESWQIPYTSRVDSVTNYQHTVAEGDDLLVGDLVLEPEFLPDLDMGELKSIILSEPLVEKRLVSEAADVTIVNATVQLPGIDTVTELPEVVSKVRAIRTSFLENFPDHDVYLSGIIMMNNSFSESALN